MTREEFDEILEQTNAVICNREWYERLIKVFEQEPCGDCISRKAVLDALNKWDWQELYLPVHFKDMIDDLPNVQPKTGRWISDKYGQYCDQCGNGINTPYKFCPFCGADMREYRSETPTDSDCNSCEYQNEVDGSNCYECVKGVRDNYKAESEKE